MTTPPPATDSVTLGRHIAARPETVFGFFTDREKWLSWMGADGTFSFEPGGASPEACAAHAEGRRHYVGRLAVRAEGGDPGPDAWMETSG
ncbi:hypothetical protein AB0B13_01650 [Streptomyces sp. NPDC042898]|uniref:hypothetical protein n=1 Tax=Streptomyces sp. NPDC042898 TaxID=3154334 RepID=UPI0033C0C0E3